MQRRPPSGNCPGLLQGIPSGTKEEDRVWVRDSEYIETDSQDIWCQSFVWAVSIQWTGLLDWTTGLDYWTLIFLSWRMPSILIIGYSLRVNNNINSMQRFNNLRCSCVYDVAGSTMCQSGTSISPIVVDSDTSIDSELEDDSTRSTVVALAGSPLKVICSERYR